MLMFLVSIDVHSYGVVHRTPSMGTNLLGHIPPVCSAVCLPRASFYIPRLRLHPHRSHVNPDFGVREDWNLLLHWERHLDDS